MLGFFGWKLAFLVLIGTETSHHGNCTVTVHHSWYSMVQERATTVMRDETYVQERYTCLNCSVWGIPKLNLKEKSYLANPCELNSGNSDGQISQAKEQTKRTYLGATPSKIDLLSVTDNCQRYTATLGETESNTLKKRHYQQHLSTLAVVCDKSIQEQIADSLKLVTVPKQHPCPVSPPPRP